LPTGAIFMNCLQLELEDKIGKKVKGLSRNSENKFFKIALAKAIRIILFL